MFLCKMLSNRRFLKLADALSGQEVTAWYDFYQKAQWWPMEKLVAYQEQKMATLLRTAIKEVPFYGELYQSHGIDVREVRSLDDLRMLPIVSKADLKNSYPLGCTRRTKTSVKELFTSGSSGAPFAVLLDKEAMSQSRALMLLRANYAGWEPGMAVFQTGMSVKRGVIKRLKDLVFDVYYACAFDLRDERLDEHLEVIAKRDIKYLMGYPGSIYALACRAQETGAGVSMQGIVTWGDNLCGHFRSRIESQFGCVVTDTYGCGEGMQIAAQCPSGNGNYHIFTPHVIVEIVDDQGQPVKRGECGHIILTKLDAGAMPFIRYKIGDVGRLGHNSGCACGRGLDVLSSIDGRDSDFIHTPSGNRLIVHFFTGIFEYYPEVRDFRVVQEELDRLVVEVVPNAGFSPAVLEAIRREILDKGDDRLRVDFSVQDQLELLPTGKRKFIVSRVAL